MWPNGWMDQDATGYGGRPRPRPRCARWGPRSPSSKRGHSPQFSAHVCCGQMAGWIKMPLVTMVGLGLGNIVLDADPAAPPRDTVPSQISAHVCCGQTAGWIKMPLNTKVGLGPGRILLHGDPAPFPKGAQPPRIFGACLLWPNGRPSQLLLSTCLQISQHRVPMLYNGPPISPQNFDFVW